MGRIWLMAAILRGSIAIVRLQRPVGRLVTLVSQAQKSA